MNEYNRITGILYVPAVVMTVAADVSGCRVLRVLRAAPTGLAQPVFTRWSDLVIPAKSFGRIFMRAIQRKKYRHPV